MKNPEGKSEKIGQIQRKMVKSYGKYARKVSWNEKWHAKYGGKVSWIVERFGKYWRKLSNAIENMEEK